MDDLSAFTGRVVSRLGVAAHAELVKAPSEGGTPVDTGWARANWVPSIGTPFEGIAGSRESAEDGRVDQGPAQQGLARVAAAYRIRQGPVFVSNNVPYVPRLNDGHSRQAPSGFVQAAIERAVRAVVASPPRQP